MPLLRNCPLVFHFQRLLFLGLEVVAVGGFGVSFDGIISFVELVGGVVEGVIGWLFEEGVGFVGAVAFFLFEIFGVFDFGLFDNS